MTKKKICAILKSVHLKTPTNLNLIASHPDLAQLLRILERLKQFRILTQDNIETFIDIQNFNRMEDIKLLHDANIHNQIYREAVLHCDSDCSLYLATALTLLHKANKLPLTENLDGPFHILILFKDIIRYLREFDVIPAPDGKSYSYPYPPGPRVFIIKNLSTIIHHSNPDLLCSIFKILLDITYQTGMGRALFTQQRLDILFNHDDLFGIKATLECLDQTYDLSGRRVQFSYKNFDLLLGHTQLLCLIPLLQHLIKSRLLTPENLDKLLSHAKPENISFIYDQMEIANPTSEFVKLRQIMLDAICEKAFRTDIHVSNVKDIENLTPDILEQSLPKSIINTTTLRINNLDEYPELLSFIQATTYSDRARFISSLKSYYFVHLTVINGYYHSPSRLKKPIIAYNESYSGSALMDKNDFINYLTPMEICAILGLCQAMLTLYMHDGGSHLWANNHVLLSSVACGHLSLTKHLLSLPQFMNLVTKNKRAKWDEDRCFVNRLLETALEGQHFALFNTLLQYPPIYKEFLYKKSPEWLLTCAVATGKISILNYLLSFKNIQNKISELKQKLYYESIMIDSVAIFERLIEFTGSNRFNGNETADKIEEALRYNSLQVVDYILASPHFSPFEMDQWSLEKFVAQYMSSSVSDEVRNRLLRIPAFFSCAEGHDYEYRQKTYAFITKQLQALHTQKSALEAQDIRAVFDVSANEAPLFFYILRHLIRRNTLESYDEIRFLLSIPGVKLLAHVAVTRGLPNELVRFAMTTGNQEAAAILLTIPAVRHLASQHDFYQEEMHGRLDLRRVAEDNESSMRALSTSEQHRLSAAIERYQPTLDAKGVESIFQELITHLLHRYETHPAQIHANDGLVINLPTTWEGWCKLRSTLSPKIQEAALKAYYKHKDHTALRYLSKPNDWIAQDAVYSNKINKCSTFSQYKSLIVMLYVAACDKEVAPIDGFTLESRLNHFIDELAHLGRAHNWDSTRIKIDANGNLLLDENGNIIVEEFDDGEGDKPSCYSGVKRRLFQSVLGHPLLKILTLDDIKQEMRDFIRAYFSQNINSKNRAMIRDAWTNLCETGIYDEGAHACLNKLNISIDLQKSFLQQLSEKYPIQFNDEPSFKKYIETSFQINKIFPIHLMRFAAETDFETLLTSPLTQEVPSQKKMDDQNLHCAKTRLMNCGALGQAVIAEIICLQRGCMSTWSTIWAKGHEKLRAIITAVCSLTEDLSCMQLSIILANPESHLSKALAMPLSNIISNDTLSTDAALIDDINATLLKFYPSTLGSGASF